MADLVVTGLTVQTDGVTSSGPIETTSGITTATGLSSPRITDEVSDALHPVELYVDAAAGDDANDGTAGNPVLTMDRLAALVPVNGYTNVYISGDPAWAGGGMFPYEGYRGHLQILAADALTVVGAPDVVTAYVAAGGAYGQDQVTPTALVPADATDRVRFLILQDDAGDDHLVKILAENTGVWETEPAGLTITGANPVTLIDLTQTLAPVAAVAASPYHHQGDVKLIGFNVTSPGADGLTGFGYSACVIDGTADVQSVNMGYNGCIGQLTIAPLLGAAAPGIHCPVGALTGSALDDLVHNDTMPGCHITMAGGASLLRLISASAPGAGTIRATVYEAGDLYVGNPEAHLTLLNVRGVLAASGLQVMDGGKVSVGNSQLGDVVQAHGTQIVLTHDVEFTSIDHDGRLKAAGTGANISVSIEDPAKVAGSDTLAFLGRALSAREGITITGNMWDAATALPAVRLDGWSEACRFTMAVGPGIDRGAGNLVELMGGYHDFGACTGDNANAGGTGLAILGLGTRFIADNGFAITGNAGGTTTIGIGSKGHVALPGAGTVENDFAGGGALTGAERLCVFEHRA